jgi:hypothetical protein
MHQTARGSITAGRTFVPAPSHLAEALAMSRVTYAVAAMLSAGVVLPSVGAAQGMNETSNKVSGGGISAPGWMGVVDAKEATAGLGVNDSKLATEGRGLKVTTGPAITYWNPANRATGNYTVKATFNEANYMGLNDHPHPYGIMIAGNDLGTPNASSLYCAAYGNGRFIVRGMGPAPFQMNGRGEANPAVHTASAKGAPVSQEIAVSVKGDKVECAINGTVVGSYDRAAVVGAGKLKSLDGVWGVRFAHNTEATVTGLGAMK